MRFETGGRPSDGVPSGAGRGTGWFRWVAIGFGLFVLIDVVILALVFSFLHRETADPQAVVEDFLAVTGDGDWPAAHGSFAASLRDRQPLELFTVVASSNADLFAVETTTFHVRSVGEYDAELSGVLRLRSGTNVPARFALAREDKAWKLTAWEIASVNGDPGPLWELGGGGAGGGGGGSRGGVPPR